MFCAWLLQVGQRGVGVRHYNRWRRLQLRLDNIGDCSEEDHALSNHGTAGYLIWLKGTIVLALLYPIEDDCLEANPPSNTQAVSWHFYTQLWKEMHQKMLTEGGNFMGWVTVMVRCPSSCLSWCHSLWQRLCHVWWALDAQGLSSGFCWVSVKLLTGSVLTMDWAAINGRVILFRL